MSKPKNEELDFGDLIHPLDDDIDNLSDEEWLELIKMRLNYTDDPNTFDPKVIKAVLEREITARNEQIKKEIAQVREALRKDKK